MHVDVSTGFLTQKPQVRLGGFGTKIFTWTYRQKP
jgi:hypothetical protein